MHFLYAALSRGTLLQSVMSQQLQLLKMDCTIDLYTTTEQILKFYKIVLLI